MRVKFVEFQGCVEIVEIKVLNVVIIISDGPKLRTVFIVPGVGDGAYVVSVVELPCDTFAK